MVAASKPSPAVAVEDDRDLAAACKAWRAARGISAVEAAAILGIPIRTFEGIEQGRDFRYAKMLLLAIDRYRPADGAR